MESKHPVSLLGEIAAKRKWILPLYEVVSEAGPHHSRKFKFKVRKVIASMYIGGSGRNKWRKLL